MHFVCSECVNVRVSALLVDAVVELGELDCPMGCPGKWSFDDFGGLIHPTNLREWRLQAIDATRRRVHEAAREVLASIADRSSLRDNGPPDAMEARRHALEIRKMLRPKCPHCGLVFESFSGCLTVTCGARDATHRQISGCGQVFCGGCMTSVPCAGMCGHAFIEQGELQRRWRMWRMRRPTEYLELHFHGGREDHHRSQQHSEQVLQMVLGAIRSDLEAVGVWPLPGFVLR